MPKINWTEAAGAALPYVKPVVDTGKWLVGANKEAQAKKWAAAQAEHRNAVASYQERWQAINRLATEKQIAKTNTNETYVDQLGLNEDEGGLLGSFKKLDKNLLLGIGVVALLIFGKK